MLLWGNLVTSWLLPALLLLPLQPTQAARARQEGKGVVASADAWLERQLRSLVAQARPARRGGRRRWQWHQEQLEQQEQEHCRPTRTLLLLRWWVVLSAAWRLSAALAAAGPSSP